MFQLEAEGYTLKAIQNLWSSSSAAGNSHFHVHPSQTNPMEYQLPEPILQIGYIYLLSLCCKLYTHIYIYTYIHTSEGLVTVWTGTITMIHLRDRLLQRTWLVVIITSSQDGLFQHPSNFKEYNLIKWRLSLWLLYWDLHCLKHIYIVTCLYKRLLTKFIYHPSNGNNIQYSIYM